MFRPARCRRSLLRFLTLAAAVIACPVAARADTVYVTSFTDGGLYRYDSSNLAGPRQTLSGTGVMTNPSALAVGPDGNLYIGESGNGGSVAPSIRKYDVATGTLSTVITFAYDVFPGSIAFKGTDMLIGRNPFYGNTGPIQKLTGWNGGTVSVTDYTSGVLLASSPGLAVAADGTLYVSDMSYNFVSGTATGPVKTFSASGSFASVLIADGQDGLAGPTGLVLSGSTLFTASIMNGSILSTDLGTGITSMFSSTSLGTFEAGVLALLSDGNLLVGSPSGSGNIYRIGTDGALLDTFATGLGQIGGIAVVPEPSLLAVGLGGAGCMAGWLRLRRRRSAGRR